VVTHRRRKLFDDVEAAKARHRKVMELAGEFAVLSFPEAAPDTG
jgi:hypothetical protein